MVMLPAAAGLSAIGTPCVEMEPLCGLMHSAYQVAMSSAGLQENSVPWKLFWVPIVSSMTMSPVDCNWTCGWCSRYPGRK
jgi:hypothetical protein